MSNPEKTPLPTMSDYAPEEAQAARVMLDALKALQKMGIDQISRATLMTLIGVDEADLKPDDYEVHYSLGELYCQNKEIMDAALESRVVNKH